MKAEGHGGALLGGRPLRRCAGTVEAGIVGSGGGGARSVGEAGPVAGRQGGRGSRRGEAERRGEGQVAGRVGRWGEKQERGRGEGEEREKRKKEKK